MHQSVKIAIVGDFNFTFNAHHATNLSLEHVQHLLEIEINHYWVRLHEAAAYSTKHFDEFDGIWIAPGPFSNTFYLQGILRNLITSKIPVLITGDGFKEFVEVLSKEYTQFGNTKVISDNLFEGNRFQEVQIQPCTKEMDKIYFNHTNSELSSCHFSIYPEIMTQLSPAIEILAKNKFDDVEIVQLKSHPSYMACMFLPQISSTRDIPHPLISNFVNKCQTP
jgi:CTP synthase (UTP-ammonia lyase)